MAASTVCSTRGLAPGDRSGDGASERFFGLLVGTENLALERGSKGKARGGLALRGIPWSTTAGLEPNVKAVVRSALEARDGANVCRFPLSTVVILPN